MNDREAFMEAYKELKDEGLLKPEDKISTVNSTDYQKGKLYKYIELVIVKDDATPGYRHTKVTFRIKDLKTLYLDQMIFESGKCRLNINCRLQSTSSTTKALYLVQPEYDQLVVEQDSNNNVFDNGYSSSEEKVKNTTKYYLEEYTLPCKNITVYVRTDSSEDIIVNTPDLTNISIQFI